MENDGKWRNINRPCYRFSVIETALWAMSSEVTFPDAAMSLLQILLNADGITMARENLQKATQHRNAALLFQIFQ